MQARLTLTALLPLSAAFPVATPAGDGSAPMAVMRAAGGPAVPHALMDRAALLLPDACPYGVCVIESAPIGLSDQEVVGRPFVSLVHPDDADEAERRLRSAIGGTDAADEGNLVEARMRDGFGAWRDTEWSLSDQRASPAVGGLVVHVRDVSERKELERTLHRTAYVDQLTGLPNRRELRRAVAAQGGAGALMVVGLGGIGGVNEVRGHDVGDAVLVEAARRLRAGVSPADVLARLGGDRFAVATRGGAVQAQLLATRLLTMLTEPYAVAGVPRSRYVSATA